MINLFLILSTIQNSFKIYFDHLAFDIPGSLSIVMFGITAIGIVSLFATKVVSGFIYFARLILIEILVIVFCTTVFLRDVRNDYYYNLQPFWSYGAIEQGQIVLLAENIMNVILFMPLGLVLGISFKNLQWWKIIVMGILFSITIETLQFYLKKGLSEFDDVLHNALGCVFGYGLYLLTTSLIRRFGF